MWTSLSSAEVSLRTGRACRGPRAEMAVLCCFYCILGFQLGLSLPLQCYLFLSGRKSPRKAKDSLSGQSDCTVPCSPQARWPLCPWWSEVRHRPTAFVSASPAQSPTPTPSTSSQHHLLATPAQSAVHPTLSALLGGPGADSHTLCRVTRSSEDKAVSNIPAACAVSKPPSAWMDQKPTGRRKRLRSPEVEKDLDGDLCGPPFSSDEESGPPTSPSRAPTRAKALRRSALRSFTQVHVLCAPQVHRVTRRLPCPPLLPSQHKPGDAL